MSVASGHSLGESITPLAITGVLSPDAPEGRGTYDLEGERETLRTLRREAANSPDQAIKLIDFAADQNNSLMTRSYALEEGAWYILHAVEDGKSVSQETRDIYDQLNELAPTYFGPQATHRYEEYGDGNWRRNNDFDFLWEIATLDESDYRTVSPNHTSQQPTLDTLYGRTPELPVLLLEKLLGSTDPNDLQNLSPQVARDALSTVLDFRGTAFQEVITSQTQTQLQEFADLRQLTRVGGNDHKAPIDFVYRFPEAERLEYARVLNRLYESAEGLRAIFPAVLGGTVTQGTQSLVANALFAVREHLQMGKDTQTGIALRNGGELPVEFVAGEPLWVLQQLHNALQKLHRDVTAPTSRTLLAASGPGFRIDRFIDPGTGQPSMTSLYTRPYEAGNFDATYEYGRPGIGVEASISYKVQVSSGRALLPLEKQVSNQDIVSVRLDREDGDIISLDVGSVLGNARSLGTQIGRLLGWGNSLRAAAMHIEPGLNHVKGALDQQYGQPDAFAGLAFQMRRQIEDKRASETEFSIYTSLAQAPSDAAR